MARGDGDAVLAGELGADLVGLLRHNADRVGSGEESHREGAAVDGMDDDRGALHRVTGLPVVEAGRVRTAAGASGARVPGECTRAPEPVPGRPAGRRPGGGVRIPPGVGRDTHPRRARPGGPGARGEAGSREGKPSPPGVRESVLRRSGRHSFCGRDSLGRMAVSAPEAGPGARAPCLRPREPGPQAPAGGRVPPRGREPDTRRPGPGAPGQAPGTRGSSARRPGAGHPGPEAGHAGPGIRRPGAGPRRPGPDTRRPGADARAGVRP